MTPSFSATELSRALRADLPSVDDDVFPVTLAQVARTAPAPTPRTGISRGLKVGAVAASLVVTVFGAAHASGLLFAPSEPAIRPPSDRQVEEPVDRRPDTAPRQSESSGQDRGSFAPGRGPSRSGVSSPTGDEAEGPDDGTEPAPSSVPGSPGVSEDQDHDSGGPDDSDGPDDNDGGPDDSDGPDQSDGPDDSDGPDVDVGEGDRAGDDSVSVDDLEDDD